MSKVYENTARRIVAFSDDGNYKLIAQRRAIQTERHGHTAYAGSYWTLDTYRREGISFVRWPAWSLWQEAGDYRRTRKVGEIHTSI